MDKNLFLYLGCNTVSANTDRCTSCSHYCNYKIMKNFNNAKKSISIEEAQRLLAIEESELPIPTYYVDRQSYNILAGNSEFIEL